ncbi:MAG: histidinol-phosphatase [Buchananella hordeovulneris]|nr:histidinol-phosphatase [Buchananella hordeovulneris]
MNSAYLADLELALEIADAVDELTLSRFGAGDLVVDSKPDLTPVSDADRRAEQIVRQLLAERRPDDSILGEEYGSQGASARRWIVDPIDGTKNFVRGVPLWASLIALADGDEVVVGVVSAPALGMRWFAAAGGGAWKGQGLAGARRLRVSQVGQVGDCSLGYSSLSAWKGRERRDDFVALLEECWRTRGYGDFFPYMMVAEGAVDACVEPELEVYDMAALAPIVVEAGGSFTNLSGLPGPFGGNALASNGLLHAELLSRLGTARA